MPHTEHRPTLRLRVDKWQRECLARGLVTDVARAAYIGVNRATVIRLQNRAVCPTGDVIAAVLDTFRARFDDLFELTS